LAGQLSDEGISSSIDGSLVDAFVIAMVNVPRRNVFGYPQWCKFFYGEMR
jgi:hypothetical protein